MCFFLNKIEELNRAGHDRLKTKELSNRGGQGGLNLWQGKIVKHHFSTTVFFLKYYSNHVQTST